MKLFIVIAQLLLFIFSYCLGFFTFFLIIFVIGVRWFPSQKGVHAGGLDEKTFVQVVQSNASMMKRGLS